MEEIVRQLHEQANIAENCNLGLLLSKAADAIEELQAENMELKKRIVFWNRDMISQLEAENAKLRRERDAAKSPVDIGDYVYYIVGGYYNSNHKEVSRPCKVVEISKKIQRNGSTVMNGFITDNGTRYSFGAIGKSVFLNPEDAKRKLEEKE